MLRALTMVLMIFVNDLWTIKGVPHWMLHSKTFEDFMGLSDVVFPSFLFAMGMSIPYAIENRFRKGLSAESTLWHIISRSFALIMMGVFTMNTSSGLPNASAARACYLMAMVVGFFLVWNHYPRTENRGRKILHTVLKVLGVALLFWLAVCYKRPAGKAFAAGWWGILGIIGWTYLLCATVYLLCRDRLRLLVPIWGIFVFICAVSTVTRSGAPFFDFPKPNLFDTFRDILHIDNGGLPILTLGGMILSVISVRYASDWEPVKRICMAVSAASLLSAAGFVSHRWFIISKNLATLPWIFWVSAMCVLLYTLLHLLADRGIVRWFNLIKPAGTATLTVYTIPYFLTGFSTLTGIHLWGKFSGIVGIAYILGYVALCIFIAWLLGKVNIKLKV